MSARREPSSPPAALLPEACVRSARQASLRYVTDDMPGIRRRNRGRGVVYVWPNGRTVRAKSQLERIASLVIPPGWTDVWICPLANGHLQATGRDARGRKQYRYHPRWTRVRDAAKFDRLIEFGEALPRIRRRVASDLALRGMPRNKVLAMVVRLMDTVYLRIGNERYSHLNGSFGLTTLRNRHVRKNGAAVSLCFRGKSGKEHTVDIRDKRLAGLVKRCRELPGQRLFQYRDSETGFQPISSDDVNDYLRQISDEEITAKDFRTWAGTMLAAECLVREDEFHSARQANAAAARAIKHVAQQLGNTQRVCRDCYIHPSILEAFTDPSLKRSLHRYHGKVQSPNLLRMVERALLRLLKQCAGRDPRRAAA